MVGSVTSSKGFELGEGRGMVYVFRGLCCSLAMPCRQLGVQRCSSGGRGSGVAISLWVGTCKGVGAITSGGAWGQSPRPATFKDVARRMVGVGLQR